MQRIGEWRQNTPLEIQTSLGKMRFEGVDEFVYSGVRLTNNCEEER